MESAKKRLLGIIRTHPIHFQNANPNKGVYDRVYPPSSGEDVKLYKLWCRLGWVARKIQDEMFLTDEEASYFETKISEISSEYILWKLEN